MCSPIVKAIRASPRIDNPALSEAVTMRCGLEKNGLGHPSSLYCSTVIIEDVLPESNRHLKFISVPAMATSTFGRGSSGAIDHILLRG